MSKVSIHPGFIKAKLRVEKAVIMSILIDMFLKGDGTEVTTKGSLASTMSIDSEEVDRALHGLIQSGFIIVDDATPVSEFGSFNVKNITITITGHKKAQGSLNIPKSDSEVVEGELVEEPGGRDEVELDGVRYQGEVSGAPEGSAKPILLKIVRIDDGHVIFEELYDSAADAWDKFDEWSHTPAQVPNNQALPEPSGPATHDEKGQLYDPAERHDYFMVDAQITDPNVLGPRPATITYFPAFKEVDGVVYDRFEVSMPSMPTYDNVAPEDLSYKLYWECESRYVPNDSSILAYAQNMAYRVYCSAKGIIDPNATKVYENDSTQEPEASDDVSKPKRKPKK